MTVSNPDRVYWPATGWTKGDMIAWYRAVAPALLPHIRSRPLTLWRYPAGVHERGFWQNECRGAPAWLRVAEVRGQRFCVVDDLRSLEWVANLGTVELHPFPWRLESPERADVLILDLDPGPPADLADCCAVALALRDRLDRPALAKTSGGAGLHVWAPADEAFAETKALARRLAEELAAERPELVVATQRRAERRGRVLVDWLQNDATRSTAAPYSLRARERPAVSTPVTWEEVAACAETRRNELLAFTPADVLARLERHGDLFAALA